ncbi:SDR family NAD(P)-dependent oxidoreductase [Fervidibacillus albus]|uniref:SDR family oxidoreductase n=1 Tax=Fervidibacillus albus TaxID=2980026 RepID=A0A9E8LUH4_9BACI|nr:SDR family NAD(P)-dependent oxidoreductase [Fervidibacillus albus]WAA09829.1 SDR family oxidoreductase [Fervidibacillus albus]
MIQFNMQGKNAIITGAASGIGLEIAKAFAEAGINVAVADLDQNQADAVAKELEEKGVRAFGVGIDVRSFEKLEELVAKTVDTFGSLDFMINCAGIGRMRPIEQFSKKDIDDVIDINLKGTIFGCKAALEYMKTRKQGKIINMSSVASRLGLDGGSIYGASKGGVNALTQAFGREAAPYNITVNAILPGVIRTNMWEQTLEEWAGDDMEKRDQLFKEFTKDIPMGRPQETKDIANTVLFLCSEAGDNITAQTIAVDGGMTI